MPATPIAPVIAVKADDVIILVVSAADTPSTAQQFTIVP
jgi:hypothetical protein